jgi:hypothetical protein
LEQLPELSFQIDIATALVALAALAMSIVLARGQSRLEKERLRLQRDSDVIEWTRLMLDALCAAENLLGRTYLDELEFRRSRDDILVRISSLVELGRLYFPNYSFGKLGLEKEPVYQGRRHPILDGPIWIYDLIRELSPGRASHFPEISDRIVRCRRDFLSTVQGQVQPDRIKLLLNVNDASDNEEARIRGATPRSVAAVVKGSVEP